MSLDKEFDEEMLGIYLRARNEVGYTATIFYQMLADRGGLDAARYLITTPRPSDGYTALFMKGRLDLTVEAVIWDNPKYHSLFTDDQIDLVRKRLVSYEYAPAMT